MRAKINRKKVFLVSLVSGIRRGLLLFCILFQIPIFSVTPVPASSLGPLFAVQEDQGILRLVSVSPANGKTGLIYTGAQDKGIPVFRKQNFIIFKTSKELNLLNLSTGKTKAIKGSSDAFPGNSGFLRDKSLLLFSRKNADRWETVLYDYEKDKELKSLPGSQPFVSPDQKSVLLVGNEVLYSERGEESFRVPIHKFHFDTNQISTLAWIETDHKKIQITDVYALAEDTVLVRIATEKENRLYKLQTQNGDLVKLNLPFYPSVSGADTKEQVNISFGPEGKIVTFTERAEGKLGNIVVVDLKTKQRYDSSFVGCFPVVKNGLVYFLGDPDFVKASKDQDYRSYGSYTLYELDYRKDKIRAVAPLSGKAELLE
ncbi:hypothetical protein ACE5IS_10435 [Leptospira wolffii]|uniref:WD40 repeat domain-containing protein n=1 Tax=Leptospira wolffii TaxID=409998 RepID=A0ABV5BMS8_9LEPT|nr:hypothetical protein [Leptospira wolffii]TGL52438.1 hypothetical protein EHQ61_05035 [Leptospira wolffii]